jgi:hypothetical protein
MENPEKIIEQLRMARAETEKQSKLVTDEMKERGAKGELWQNKLCKAWPDYERAEMEFATLRNKYEV